MEVMYKIDGIVYSIKEAEVKGTDSYIVTADDFNMIVSKEACPTYNDILNEITELLGYEKWF